MPRAGSSGSIAWKRAQVKHMEDYLALFIRRISSPTVPLPNCMAALEEVSELSKRMELEASGAVPRIRRGKPGV